MGRHGLIHRIARSRLPTIRCIALVLSASVIVICCWPLPDRAESPKSIGLELNKLEQQGGNCRAYLVIANPGTDAFTGFTLDLIVFDHSGTISRRLAVELAPLRAPKTMVKVFDIPETACTGIGNILVNDVLHCRGANGELGGCIDRITTSSKLSVKLSR
ncbi:MAG TPA: Tat pathway signal sequence domain protein [Stellaceae bacterium]